MTGFIGQSSAYEDAVDDEVANSPFQKMISEQKRWAKTRYGRAWHWACLEDKKLGVIWSRCGLPFSTAHDFYTFPEEGSICKTCELLNYGQPGSNG